MKIPIKNPETKEAAKFFETVIFPRCTAVICDEKHRITGIEMNENDFFWLMVSIYSQDDEDETYPST